MAGKRSRKLTKLSTLDKTAGKQPTTDVGVGKSGKSGDSSQQFVDNSARAGVETDVEEPSRKRGRGKTPKIAEDFQILDLSEGNPDARSRSIKTNTTRNLLNWIKKT